MWDLDLKGLAFYAVGMGQAKAKTINLLLYEGSLDGVISMEDSSWNAGELYSAPRESVHLLLDTDACRKYGIYLLLSKDQVYVGQSSDLSRRLHQHMAGKDWWESAVILTTKDDSFDHSDIDWLESVLIGKAQQLRHLDCENKNRGNPPKVSRFRQVFLEQYLEEALFLMRLVGITVFTDRPDPSHLHVEDVRTRLSIGTRQKRAALEWLREQGVELNGKVTYAVKKPDKEEFWANPQKELLEQDWQLVLNDTGQRELTVLQVPAGTVSGLLVRKDKPHLIDLNLEVQTLQDRKTGVDFSPYFVRKLKY